MERTYADGSTGHATNADPWGVYIRGMDEWHACASQQEAEEYAHQLNAHWIGRDRRSEFDPWMWAVPDLWPYGHQNHAAALEVRNADRVVQ